MKSSVSWSEGKFPQSCRWRNWNPWKWKFHCIVSISICTRISHHSATSDYYRSGLFLFPCGYVWENLSKSSMTFRRGMSIIIIRKRQLIIFHGVEWNSTDYIPPGWLNWNKSEIWFHLHAIKSILKTLIRLNPCSNVSPCYIHSIYKLIVRQPSWNVVVHLRTSDSLTPYTSICNMTRTWFSHLQLHNFLYPLTLGYRENYDCISVLSRKFFFLTLQSIKSWVWTWILYLLVSERVRARGHSC